MKSQSNCMLGKYRIFDSIRSYQRRSQIDLSSELCYESGFLRTHSRDKVIRPIAFLGALVVCNGQPLAVLKRITHSRTDASVRSVIDQLTSDWAVGVAIENDRVHLYSMGPILNPDPEFILQKAFPKKKIFYRGFLYQLS